MIAFSGNNLQQVAKLISKKHPNAKITIAADNDRFKDGNPGLTKAKEAAAAVKARLVVPEFASDEGEPIDFNDLYVNEGTEKVSDAFLKYNQERKSFGRRSRNFGRIHSRGF
jgi:putative DNA primase/helicase